MTHCVVFSDTSFGTKYIGCGVFFFPTPNLCSFSTLSNSLRPTVLCLVAQLCPTLSTPWTVAHQAPLSMGTLLGIQQFNLVLTVTPGVNADPTG